MSGLTTDEIRKILKELKAAVPRAWGGSYVEDHLKQPQPAPNLQWLFHMTLAGNRPELGRRLLAAGAEPRGKDPDGKFAWEHVREAEAASLLLEAGVPAAAVTEDGATSWLGWAVFNQKPGYVRLLLDDGADVHHRDAAGSTPLLIGARYGDTSILRMLLTAGAPVNDSNNTGETALTIAAGRGHTEAVRLLIEAGADVADQGFDALWSATRERKKAYLQIIELLLAAGADPNGSGSTPLIRAVSYGSPEMVQALVAGGAEINATSNWGSALHATVDENRPEMVPVLLELGADPTLQAPGGAGESAGLIRDDWWNAGWLPFTTNGGGDSHCVDLAPADGGISGQIITMFHAEEKRELVARSFAEWLASLADELEQGDWTLDDAGGVDRP